MSRRREDFKPSPGVGFIAIICDTCAAGTQDIELLREAVRRSPHGMLVRVHCPLGMMYCHARQASANAGRVVVVQPCNASRTPLGSAVIVGPVRTAEDLAVVARWLETRPIDETALPVRLRGIPHPRQQSIQN